MALTGSASSTRPQQPAATKHSTCPRKHHHRQHVNKQSKVVTTLLALSYHLRGQLLLEQI
jgi:hypothetical protein